MKQSSVKRFDDRASSSERGYGHAWRKARESFLRKHPLCRMHADMGRVVEAVVVDHIVPHRGDMVLFWDSGNWQSLCVTCHSSIKQRIEAGGRLPGCGLDGVPVDPGHHWAAARKA